MKKFIMLSSLIITSHLSAATLTFDVSKVQAAGFHTYAKGADIASDFTPVKDRTFIIPNAAGKNIPVSTNVQIINSAGPNGSPLIIILLQM